MAACDIDTQHWFLLGSVDPELGLVGIALAQCVSDQALSLWLCLAKQSCLPRIITLNSMSAFVCMTVIKASCVWCSSWLDAWHLAHVLSVHAAYVPCYIYIRWWFACFRAIPHLMLCSLKPLRASCPGAWLSTWDFLVAFVSTSQCGTCLCLCVLLPLHSHWWMNLCI